LLQCRRSQRPTSGGAVQATRKARLGPLRGAGCCPESDGIHSKSIGDSACTGTHSLRRVQELGLVKPLASQAPLVVSLLHDSIGLVEQQQQCMHDSGDRRRKNASSAQYFHVHNPESLQVQKNWVAAHEITWPTTAQQCFCLDVEPLSHFIIGAAEFTSIQGTVHHWYFLKENCCNSVKTRSERIVQMTVVFFIAGRTLFIYR
jgi:hypothetical protein